MKVVQLFNKQILEVDIGPDRVTLLVDVGTEMSAPPITVVVPKTNSLMAWVQPVIAGLRSAGKYKESAAQTPVTPIANPTTVVQSPVDLNQTEKGVVGGDGENQDL